MELYTHTVPISNLALDTVLNYARHSHWEKSLDETYIGFLYTKFAASYESTNIFLKKRLVKGVGKLAHEH